MKMEKLQSGDTVAVVSLSWGGAHQYPQRFKMGVQALEQEFGLNVKVMPEALKPEEWLAKNPQARANDLNLAFADPEVKAIFSVIGGDDALRILPFLDKSLIARHPKIFMGYSDTTVIHLFLHKLGIHSFYGPAVMAGFAEAGGMLEYTRDAVKSVLFSQCKGLIPRNRAYWLNQQPDFELNPKRERLAPLDRCRVQGEGQIRGKLLGGCLEVLEFCRGTQAWPEMKEWQDAIFFVEVAQGETTTPPERLTWFLRSLASSGELSRINGILFGRPGQQIDVTEFVAYENALRQVLAEEGLSDMPVIARVEFGHTDPMCVLPYGLETEICAETCDIRFLHEPALG